MAMKVAQKIWKIVRKNMNKKRKKIIIFKIKIMY